MIPSPTRQAAQLTPDYAASRRIRSNSNPFSAQLMAGLRTGQTRGSVQLGDIAAAASHGGRADPILPITAKILTVPTITPATPTPTPVTPKAATKTPSTDFTDTQNAIQVLMQALQDAGIDPGALGINGHDDPVAFPGGTTYTNHEITLKAGSHTENYSAELVMKAPSVAVTEIQRLISMG